MSTPSDPVDAGEPAKAWEPPTPHHADTPGIPDTPIAPDNPQGPDTIGDLLEGGQTIDLEAGEAEADTIPDDTWKRFHWATPFLSLWKLWAALIAAVFSILVQALEEGAGEIWEAVTGVSRNVILIAAGTLLAISLLVILIAWLVWRKQRYVLAPSGVHYRSGIFSLQHRHVRWDRIQSVEIKQGIIPRLLGLGSILIDSASSGENLSLGLLKMNEIHGLRTQILTIASAARQGTEFTVDAVDLPQMYDPDDAYMHERPFYTLPTGRLVGSMLRSGALLGVLAGIAIILLPLIWFEQSFSIGILVTAVGALAALWGQFNANYALKLFLTGDGIRVRRGLTTTSTQTIPPRRIHAVTLEQPLLWRRKDWWQVKVLIAGAISSETENVSALLTKSVIMPVGDCHDALDLLWTIVPDIGVDDVGGFLTDALSGKGPSPHFHPAPRSSRFLDPFRRKRNGIALTSTAAVHRDGWLRRQVTVALHGHWQGLKSSQGPVQRRLSLATFSLCLVTGDTLWNAKNFDVNQVRDFLTEERNLGLQRRAVDERESIDEWAKRVGVL